MDREIFNFVVMDLEGGARLTRDPLDPGGTTKYGISQRFNPDIDVANLDESGASDVYHVRYWVPTGCSNFPKHVALVVFDCAINQGVDRAKKFLQTALGVVVDGDIGPKTIARSHAVDFGSFLVKFYEQRVKQYLSRDDAVEEHNEKGWMNRKTKVIVKAMQIWHEDNS